MDILLYLTELLQTRKTVGIVGLGTLYKKKSPGKYDAQKHAFVPPSYTLAFTTAVEEQDELANFISQKRNITVDSANYYISEFAERIHSELVAKQESSLEPLGKLNLVNDEINFTAAEANEIGFEFYGLPTVNEIQKDTVATPEISSNADEVFLEQIEEENKLEEENSGQETEEDLEENILVNDEQEVFEEISEVKNQERTYHHLNDLPPVIETVEDEAEEEPTEEIVITQEEEYIEEEEEEPKRGMPFFMKFLIAFLIIVALGAIVYFINPQFFNSYFNQNFAGKKENSVQILTNDTLNNKLDTAKADTLSKNNDLITVTIDSPSNAVDSSKVTIYEVLVSAVATEKKADKIIANLNIEGVKAKKIKLSKTMINISAGSFLINEDAIKHRDSLRKKLKNQGIYIQPIKPKTHKK